MVYKCRINKHTSVASKRPYSIKIEFTHSRVCQHELAVTGRLNKHDKRRVHTPSRGVKINLCDLHTVQRQDLHTLAFRQHKPAVTWIYGL